MSLFANSPIFEDHIQDMGDDSFENDICNNIMDIESNLLNMLDDGIDSDDTATNSNSNEEALS